jgi:hypothetical protein
MPSHHTQPHKYKIEYRDALALSMPTIEDSGNELGGIKLNTKINAAQT